MPLQKQSLVVVKKMNKKGPILLFPTHYLGNFILGLPWVQEISNRYPDTVLVIDPVFLPLVEAAEVKPEYIIYYPREHLSKSNNIFIRIKSYLEFLVQLRRFKNRCLLDLEGERFTGVVSLLSGCSVRIGPKQRRSSWFYSISQKLNYEKHRFNAFGEIIRKWGSIETPSNKLEYVNNPIATTSVFQLHNKKNTLTNFIVIHPGASALYKRWPALHFSKLYNLLSREGYNVVWIGAGASDSKILEEIETISGPMNFLNFCDRLSFPELISLFQASTLFIGADSGPMHLAASTGLPVLGLFGPSNDKIWEPLGADSKFIRGKLLCDESCKGKSCESTRHCLETLHPQVVFNVVLSSLPNLKVTL
jgi:heptosyltransferase-3